MGDGAADRIRAFDFSQILTRLTRDFFGREWLLDRIAEWVSRGEKSILLIEGPPGAGKSAITAQLAKTRSDVAAVHFCLAEDVRTIRPGRMLRSIASMLAEAIPGYAAALANTINPARLTVHVDIHAQAVEKVVGVIIEHLHAPLATEELDLLLQAPLSVLPPPIGPVVILLDALDEALTLSEDENIVSLLAAAQGLPPWLRFVCTARPDERIRSRLLKADVIDLRLMTGEVAQDVARYVEVRIKNLGIRELSRRAVIDLCKAEPNFLFAKLILDDLALSQARYFDPHSGELLETLPSDLEGLYRLFLARLPRSKWERIYQRLLSALCVAREPWTERQLAAFSGLSLGDLRRDALAVAQFLSVQIDPGGRQTFALFHPSFRRFLANPDASRSHYCDEGDGHSLVAGPPENRLERFTGFDALDPYLQVYGLSHLCSAGDVATALKMLASFEWLRKKTSALGIDALIADFEIGAPGLEAGAPVARLLRRTSHFLRRDPSQLAGQLLIGLRPATTPVAEALILGACAHTGEVWLRPLGDNVRTHTGASQTIRVRGAIDGVAISKDGRRAFFGHDSMATLLDLENGKEICSYSDHKSNVEAVAMSQDGLFFVTAPLFDNISIRSIDGRAQRLDWRKEQNTRVFLTDSLLFAIGERGDSSEREKILLCWDWEKNCQQSTPVIRPDGDLFIARGGRVVVRDEDDGQVKAWRVREPEKIITLSLDSTFRKASPDLSPDGRLLAHQTGDGNLIVRDLDTGKVTYSIKPPCEAGDKAEAQLAFADEGRLLALLIFDLNDNLRPAQLTIWDLITGEQLLDAAAHNGMAFALVGSDCSPRFLTGSHDGELKLWEPRSVSLASQQSSGHSKRVTCLAFSGERILSGGDDGAVVTWGLTGKPFRVLSAHEERVAALSLDSKRGIFVTVGENGEVRVWDLETGDGRHSFRPPGGAVAAHVLNAEELVCFLKNGGIGRWSMRRAIYQVDLNDMGGPRGITGAAASERQLFAFLSGEGGEMRTSSDITFWQAVVWDAGEREIAGTTLWRGTQDSLTPAISRDGQYVYVGLSTGVQRLLVSDMQVSRTYPHDAAVDLVAIDAAGKRLATTTRLGELRMLDEETGGVLAQFGLDISASALSISDDGRFVGVGAYSGEVLLFELVE